MSPSILCTLVFFGIIGYNRVCGNEVTLECPPGYLIKAWPTYYYEQYEKTEGSEENKKITKSLLCLLCKSRSVDNATDLEICSDKGFTEGAKTSPQYGFGVNKTVLRYQASTGHTVKKKNNFCDDQNHGRCRDEVCSANLTTDNEGRSNVTFNECKNEIKHANVRGTK